MSGIADTDTLSRTPRGLSDLIGQTLLVGFEGVERTGVVEQLIGELRPGGLVLLPRNVQSPEQVAALVCGVQGAARAAGLPPLLIAVDQEGGSVLRLTDEAGFTDLPSAMMVGATGRPEAAQALATVAAREMRAVGITLALAPVADLATNPRNTVIGTRSFGSEPGRVASFVAASVEGLQREGVLATVKHFPGHGPTDVDSHLGLPVLDATEDEIDARDLAPFRAAIRAGVAAVMTAHVVPPWDAERPATLSRRTLDGLLRGTLGHAGPVLTDSLEMQALVAAGYRPAEAAAEALAAGADVLVFDGDLGAIRAAVAEVERRTGDGRLAERRLLEAWNRINQAKRRLAGLAPVEPRPGSEGHVRHAGEAAVGCAIHRDIAEAVAASGLEVRDAGSMLPLRATPVVLASETGRAFAERVGWPVVSPDGAAHGPTAGGPPMVAPIFDPDDDADSVAALRQAVAAQRPVVVVLLGNPHVLPVRLDGITTVLAHDLPRSLWHVVAGRLVGEEPRVSLETALSTLARSDG